MNSIGKIIISLFTLIIVIATFVILITYTVPLNVKKDVDMKLDYYLSVMERQSGLRDSQITDIRNYLTNRQFENVVINITKVGTSNYSEDMILHIKAKMNILTPIDLYKKEIKKQDYEYKELIPNNRVGN